MEIKRSLRLGPVGLGRIQDKMPTTEGFGAHLRLLGLSRGDIVAVLDCYGEQTSLLAQVTGLGEGTLTLQAYVAESEMGVISS